MTILTNNKLDNQSKLLAEFPEVQDISNESAASIQGGYVKLYDWRNQNKWLGTFHWGSSRLSPRANDDVSSVYIQEGVWDFYQHSHYRGRKIRLGRGKYNLRNLGFDQMMSSLRRVS